MGIGSARAGARNGSVGGTRASALWTRGGRLIAALCAVVATALVAAPGALADAYVPPYLLERAEGNPSARLAVIVVAEPGYGTTNLRRKALAGRDGPIGEIRREFEVIPALALTLTGAELVELAAKPGVASISSDGRLVETHHSGGTGPSAEQLWRQAVRVAALNKTTARKTPPAIAVVDSGVDFGLSAFPGFSIARNFSSYEAGDGDGLGHGTLVAGIAAANGPYAGVSPASKLVSLRVLSHEGRSYASDLLAATDWLYANARQKDVRVVNFSVLSVSPDLGLLDPINLAVERLWRRGIVVVAAAGNHGAGDMLYAPASSPFVITVGAVDTNSTAATDDDFEAPWSGYGRTAEGFAKPELVAPGRYMVGPVARGSLFAELFADRLVGGGYTWMSGTSFSAPVVAGAAAQILAKNPDWTPDQVKGALMATARPLPLATAGAAGVGEIDPVAATALSVPPDGNAHLAPFLAVEGRELVFDRDAWASVAVADPGWAAASWANASWANASWANASWANASWANASWANASWANASWANASWANASWAKASWAKASWAKLTELD